MKSHFLTLFFIVLFCHFTIGQKYSREFGVIGKSEFDLTTYDKDPEAEAVVLFDIGESYFEYSYSDGFNIRFTRTKRIKVLSEAGISIANIEIPFYEDGYGRTERIESIKAKVYNTEDGIRYQETSLDNSQIFEEQLNKYWKVKKFALPNVKAGSIIEYEYVHSTPFMFNLPDWEFQSHIPTVYSEYTVKLIPFYEYVYLRQGDPIDGVEEYLSTGMDRSVGGYSFKDMIFKFHNSDVPAFRDETFISSRNDYISKVDFQLSKVNRLDGSKQEIISTWPNLIDDMLKSSEFGKFIKQAEKVASKEILPSLDLAGKSQLQQTEIIINYVKENYTWDQFNGKYTRQSIRNLLDKKEGNISEINLLTTGTLRAAGIKANPVIISTRNHGKINTNYPFASFFNYVIVLIEADGLPIMADASEPLLGFHQLPIRALNDYGLIIEEDQTNWINLNAGAIGSNFYNITLNPEPDSTKISYMISQQSDGLEAYDLKQKYDDDKDKMIKYLENDDYLQVRKIITKNFDQNTQPYLTIHGGQAMMEKLDDQILIKPFLNIPILENPLKQKTRTYPVDLIYKQTNRFGSSINIPAGYTASFIPRDFKLDNDLIFISYLVVNMENKILVKGEYEFKKSIYEPSEYEQLQRHFNSIVRKFNEVIVIEPITK